MILERLKEYIDYRGISVAAFERSIGMANASFGKSLKNKGAIGTDKLEKILSIYSEISPVWLMTGEGNMLKSPSSPSTPIDERSTEPAHHVPEGNREGIPLLPISAMAGAFTDDISVMEYECERYVVPVFKGADFLIPVKGSSMYPKYSSGDIVACQRVPMSDLFFQWNKVYVIDTNQGALIKRIKPGSTPDKVLIVSDNEKYDPFELPISAIHAVALVIGVIRLE